MNRARVIGFRVCVSSRVGICLFQGPQPGHCGGVGVEESGRESLQPEQVRELTFIRKKVVALPPSGASLSPWWSS